MPEKQKSSLTKHKLAREVAYLLDIPFRPYKKYSGPGHKIVTIILQVIADALQRGESVFIPGFGTFKWYERPARRNTVCYSFNGKPATRSSPRVTNSLPAKRKVIFQPSKVLQKMINDHGN